MGCVLCCLHPKYPKELYPLYDLLSGSGNSGLTLNHSQKMHIRSTWKILEPKSEQIGEQVFLRIFDLNPEIKKLFKFEYVWGDDLLNHPKFKSHSARFIMVIRESVKRLDKMNQAFVQTLVQLGAHHTSNKFFIMSNFQLFVTSILYVFELHLKEKLSSECKESWEILLEFIMYRLQEGFCISQGSMDFE